MQQPDLFGEALPAPKLPGDLLSYYPAVFSIEKSIGLMRYFIETVPWQQPAITMYGKQMITPRLTAWYGDAESDYTFSGTKYEPLPWTGELMEIREIIEPFAGIRFNSVLLNYYRDGNDSVAWHSDDEYDLGINPVIASVSFGQARRFDVRQKSDHRQKYAINLQSGSLLLMKGDLQHNWEHQVPKSAQPLKERVNLTFRVITK